MADTYLIDRLYSPHTASHDRINAAKDAFGTEAALHARHIEELAALKNRIMHIEHNVEAIALDFTKFREYAEQVHPGISAAFHVKQAMEDAHGD